MDDKEGRFRWELAYPTTFFVALADRLLANLGRYLEVHDIDPCTHSKFGSIWQRVLLKRQ